MQRALVPPLAAHDGGEADVVEDGRGGEASRRVLTWRREKSYRRQEQVHGELTVTVLKKDTRAKVSPQQ